MPKKDTITENFHGTMVEDPYRYLEDSNEPATLGLPQVWCPRESSGQVLLAKE